MFEFDPERHYPKETESRIVIRFQDCDPLQHLNNAKYFDYYFNAREDQVPKLYGVEMMDFIRKYKSTWVVYNHNISYVKPAKVGEWVRIMTRVLWHDQNTAVIEYYMTDDDRQELKNLMWTTLKYVTIAEGRLTDHQGSVEDYLKATSLQMDISQMTITQRVKAIKEHLKKN